MLFQLQAGKKRTELQLLQVTFLTAIQKRAYSKLSERSRQCQAVSTAVPVTETITLFFEPKAVVVKFIL